MVSFANSFPSNHVVFIRRFVCVVEISPVTNVHVYVVRHVDHTKYYKLG